VGLASDHKYLRICDLCKELGIACLHAHIAAERERKLAITNTFGFVTCARNWASRACTRILQRSGSGKPRPTLVWCLCAR
jgi:hypothetical protein